MRAAVEQVHSVREIDGTAHTCNRHRESPDRPGIKCPLAIGDIIRSDPF